MCRSIKTLRGTEPTAEEVRAAALQFVRKISGYRSPSKANEATFSTAVDEVEAAASRLLDGLSARPGSSSAGVGSPSSTARFVSIPGPHRRTGQESR